MKRREIIAVILLLLAVIVTPLVLCIGWGEKPVAWVEMTAKMPWETNSFNYYDLEALRADPELAEYYQKLESSALKLLWLEWGIEWKDIKRASYGVVSPSPIEVQVKDNEGNPVYDEEGKPVYTTKNRIASIFEGEFTSITGKLKELGYERQAQPYKGVELWVKNGQSCVAPMGDTIIASNLNALESVKAYIDVIKGGDDSFKDSRDIYEIKGRLPSGITMSFVSWLEIDSVKYSLCGVSYEKKDEGWVKVKAVYRFKSKEDASRAMDIILVKGLVGALGRYQNCRHIKIREDGNIIEITAEEEMGDFIKHTMM